MTQEKRDLIVVGKKVGMTQLYNAKNQLTPVTIVKAYKATISRVKTTETDGYNAVQFQFEKAKSKRSHLFKEARVNDTSKYEPGETILLSELSEGDLVDVSATTKGKGFQGVMKRHGFSGGPAAHGSMFHRRGGSYGQRQWPGQVFPGKKMPGHDGNTYITIQNLEIVKVVENDLLAISGSLPGPKDNNIIIQRAKKDRKQI